MSKALKEIEGFLAKLTEARTEAEALFPDGFASRLESLKDSVANLHTDVSNAYDTAEEDFDEEEDGAEERLEALEQAKDDLDGLADKLDDAYILIDNLTEKFEDILANLNGAKDGLA